MKTHRRPDTRHKLSDVADPPAARAHKLPCGHSTTAPPISSGPSGAFYRCPEGCELQKVKRT